MFYQQNITFITIQFKNFKQRMIDWLLVSFIAYAMSMLLTKSELMVPFLN